MAQEIGRALALSCDLYAIAEKLVHDEFDQKEIYAALRRVNTILAFHWMAKGGSAAPVLRAPKEPLDESSRIREIKTQNLEKLMGGMKEP